MKQIHNSIRLILFVFLILSFVGCDRITKEIAKEHLATRGPVSYLHGTIQLSYAENSGAGMSVGAHWSPSTKLFALKIIPAVVLLMVLMYTIWNSQRIHLLPMLAIVLIVSGGIGNLIDWVFHQNNVIDFMNIGFLSIRTGIFNVADVCITCGVFLLLLSYRFQKRYISP